MRRTDLRRGQALAVLAAVTALALVGAGSARKKRYEPPPTKVEETVSNIASIVSRAETKVEGVGLVIGLENTGSDPPPSWYRQKLLEEMRKAGVENANKMLADSRMSMVIVRATIPTGVGPTDRLDIEVETPPASGTTSLAGGYLLQTRLREVLIAGGTPKEGPEQAIAEGPIMIGTPAQPDNPKVGRVLGGARVKKEVPFSLVLKENRRSFRTSALVESEVNKRFHQTEGVDQKGVAKAKTDQYLELKVPHAYHHNQPRFFRVVQLLPMVDTPALRVQRMAAWGKELLDPKTAGVAALKLEGLGPNAIEPLKAGLASPNAQVRFFAAETLAYLNDVSGAEVLGETATRQREFRAYALAALAALDEPAAHMILRRLMDQPDVEVRYGAFDALKTHDENDPFLGRVHVIEEPPDPDAEEAGESMSLAIAGASRRRDRQEDPFALYLVECDGPPMIHVACTRRCEIVVFGRSQKLLTPLVLGQGAILLNAADGDDSLQISKIVPSRFGDSDTKITSSLELGDVIRRTANLGAKYPEIVSILQAASTQKNLPGPLVVDAVPGTSPEYIQAAILGKDTTAKKDDAVKKTKLEETTKKKPGDFFGLFRRLAK
jgi:flagellar basal body P-ring protein FlgI